MEFIEYKKCSTCKKAKEFLEKNNIKYIDREIKENTPTIEEITSWINNYNIEIKKLFNTSGLLYKEYKLKDKIDTMTEKEKIDLLANNAMLIKRPILVTDKKILVGFKEKEWAETIK